MKKYRLALNSCLIQGLLAISAVLQTNAQGIDSLPEQMVKIGHHSLRAGIHKQTGATFTIVFISGGGGGLKDWTKVVQQFPAVVSMVAYDRAGSGKSEMGVLPETMTQEVLELHTVLQQAGFKKKILLVGQSIGGLVARLYTEKYDNEVAGLVLVDPTHESAMLGSMKYGGWVRLREKASGKPIPAPQLEKDISAGYDSTADYFAEELQQIYLSRLTNPGALANRPLIIIGAGAGKQPPGTPDDLWNAISTEKQEQKRGLTGLSTNAKFILDPTSGHNIQNDNPAIVVQAIEEVMKAVEMGKKL